jgi:penicillin amidase
MTVLLRWLLRLVTFAVALSVASAAVLFWIASRSIPDYEADWTVEGISAPVEIVRNTAAVPHIFGETDADVFFGLGFAHAQDRLWQMLMLRRTAQGRLSELFGPRRCRSTTSCVVSTSMGMPRVGRRAGARDAGRARGLFRRA